jgi:hypothetical protein
MAYATTTELARILHIRTPTAEQTIAMQGDLDTASLEIDDEIDLAADADALTAAQTALVKNVCLDRAADLWNHRESKAGATGLFGDEGLPMPGRYSWERYAQRLANVKNQWGIA